MLFIHHGSSSYFPCPRLCSEVNNRPKRLIIWNYQRCQRASCNFTLSFARRPTNKKFKGNSTLHKITFELISPVSKTRQTLFPVKRPFQLPHCESKGCQRTALNSLAGEIRKRPARPGPVRRAGRGEGGGRGSALNAPQGGSRPGLSPYSRRQGSFSIGEDWD